MKGTYNKVFFNNQISKWINRMTITGVVLIMSLSPLVAFGTTSDQESAHPSTVREDRYWIYNYHGGGSMAYPDETNILIRSEFDGTEEINGVTYHRFITTSLTNNIKFPVYLLREDNGVVYLRISSFLKPGDNYDEYDVSMEEYLKDKTEHVLYDFTRVEGESYKAIRMFGALYDGLHLPATYDGGAFYITDMEHNVIKTEMVTINGESYRSITTIASKYNSERTYIEGVGLIPDLTENMRFNANFDFLTYQELDDMHTTFKNQYQCHLVGVYDKDDNLIYAGRLELGVEGMPDDDKFAGIQSPVYFNLQGQPVTNPEKGNLYIERTSAGTRKILF